MATRDLRGHFTRVGRTVVLPSPVMSTHTTYLASLVIMVDNVLADARIPEEDCPGLHIFQGTESVHLPRNPDDMIAGSLTTMHPSGSITLETFIKYIKDVLVPYIERTIPGGLQKGQREALITFDLPTVHQLPSDLCRWLAEKGIHAYGLPHNSTHWSQVLDNTHGFGCFKPAYYDALDAWLVLETKAERTSGVVSTDTVARLMKTAWSKMTTAKKLAAFRCTGMIPGHSMDMKALRRTAQAKIIASAPDAVAATASAIADAANAHKQAFGIPIDAYTRFMLAHANSSDTKLTAHPQNRVDSVAVRIAPGELLTHPESMNRGDALLEAKHAKAAKKTSSAQARLISKRTKWKSRLAVVKEQVQYALDRFRRRCPLSRQSDFTSLERDVIVKFQVQDHLIDSAEVARLKKMRLGKGQEIDAEVGKVVALFNSIFSEFGHVELSFPSAEVWKKHQRSTNKKQKVARKNKPRKQDKQEDLDDSSGSGEDEKMDEGSDGCCRSGGSDSEEEEDMEEGADVEGSEEGDAFGDGPVTAIDDEEGSASDSARWRHTPALTPAKRRLRRRCLSSSSDDESSADEEDASGSNASDADAPSSNGLALMMNQLRKPMYHQ